MPGIPVDHVFTGEENRLLTHALLQVRKNPYNDYPSFRIAICRILEEGACIPGRFVEMCVYKRCADLFEDPYVRLENCPVDPDPPFLDLDIPVIDKRRRKTTFVAEGFLEMYAQLMGQEPIGYINVNDGDIFQDIHPMRKMFDTQSQKATGPIYFHKDLANHFVRPDWVNILGMRSCEDNEIYTSFVRNKDLIDFLDADVLGVMQAPEFYTPYDDLTVSSTRKRLGRAPNHPVLGGAGRFDIRFFENRTIGTTARAREVVDEIIRAIHVLKFRLKILKGDFIGSANNECLHSKEILSITDGRAVENRWLIKTVNVKFLDTHKMHMRPGEIRIIDG